MKIKCKICGKEIIKKPKESYKQFNNRVTCSLSCKTERQKGKSFTGMPFDRTGVKHSNETKKKLSEKMKGRTQTEEHTKNSIEARGYKFTPKENRAEYRYFYGIKRNYGMRREDYEKMLKNQKGVCLICGNKNKKKRRLCVDHCHNTGEIRGLLCADCNLALGKVNDDVKILNKMIKYLKK